MKILFILITLASTIYAQAGLPDPQFVNGGSTTTYLPGNNALMDLIVDKNSSIYAAGISKGSNDEDFTIIKYKPYGIVDSSFGIDGVSLVDFGQSNEYACALAFQSTGKIVVAGTQSISTHGLLALARVYNDGIIDNTFGTNGKLLFNPISFSYFGWIEDLVILENDDILVSGYIFDGSGKWLMVIKFDANGNLDENFGENGLVRYTLNESVEIAQKILITQENKIVLIVKSQYFPMVLRLNEEGTIDTTFGNNGYVLPNMRLKANGGKIGSDGFSGALQADGKILLVGYETPSGSLNKDDMCVVRLNTDGSIDTEFGNEGYTFIDYAGGNDWGRNIALQDDGKILVCGDFNVKIINDGDMRMGVARLNQDGSLDTSFGIDGKAYSMQGHYGISIAISPNDKLVLGGTLNTNRYYVVSKFLLNNNATAIGENNETTIESYILEQNYPNPFNPSTNISFAIPNTSKGDSHIVELAVFNLLGEKVATLVNEQKSAGVYRVEFNTSNLTSGIYIYRLKAGRTVLSKKMILLK